MNVPEGVVVGLDVAQAARDVAVRPSGEERHLANDPLGIAEAVAWLQAMQPHVDAAERDRGRGYRRL